MLSLGLVKFVLEGIAAVSFSSKSYMTSLRAHTWERITDKAQAQSPREISEGGLKEEVWPNQ